MAFLLFAFMKLSVKRRIDQKQLRYTQIMSKIDQLTEQQGIMAQAKTATQSALSMFYQSNNMMASNTYQKSIFALQSEFGKYETKYNTECKEHNNDKTNKDVKDSYDSMMNAQLNAKGQYESLMADFQRAQAGNQMSQQLMTSIFTNADQVQASVLHTQETQLSTEKDSLESELKLLNGQYESYKQQEEKEAKNLAPNFGQA